MSKPKNHILWYKMTWKLTAILCQKSSLNLKQLDIFFRNVILFFNADPYK